MEESLRPSTHRGLKPAIPQRIKGRSFSALVSIAATMSLLVTGLVWAQPASAADTCGTTWSTKWPAGGAGTSASPYLIDSQASLAAISDCSGSYFALDKNIALTSAWTPIFGGTASPGGTAYLDGRGWSISGLSITGSNARAGLFGQLNGGYIKNLTLVSPSVTSTDASGWTGAFAVEAEAEAEAEEEQHEAQQPFSFPFPTVL